MRRPSSSVPVLLLALSTALVFPGPSRAQSVLVIPDTTGSYTPSIESELVAAGMTVTRAPVVESSYQGTNPSPAGFDVVLHMNGTTSSVAMPSNGRTALLSFVNGGGGYVTHEYSSYESDFTNTTTDLRPLLPLVCSGSYSTLSVTVDPIAGLANHPLWLSTGAFGVSAARPTCTPRAPFAQVVAQDRQYARSWAATGLHGTGRTVAFTHTGNSAGFATAESRRMTVNAVRWAGKRAAGTVRATDQHLTTDEDVQVLVDLLATTTNGGTPTYAVSKAPSNGSIVGTPPSIRYVPNNHFNGRDAITFSATNGSSVDYAYVTFDVRAVPDPPAAPATLSVSATEDSPVSFVLAVSDPDGDSVTPTIATVPTNGTLTRSGSTYTYTPVPDFHGTDTAVVRFADPGGNVADTTITFTVAPRNDAPFALTDGSTIDEDTPTDIALPASDVDGDTLACVVAQSPATGTLAFVDGCTVRYSPVANFNGTAQFRWYARDPAGATSATVDYTITIRAVNDAPAANARSVVVDRNSAITIGLTGSDVDGDGLAFSIATPPTNGALTGTPPSVTYRPTTDYVGPDSFEFRVTDPSGASATAVVSVTVRVPNVAPVAHDDAFTTPEDTLLAFNARATDPDGAVTAWTVVSVSTGTLSGALPTASYTPPANFNGTATIRFQVSDGEANSNVGTITITVTPVNDPPVASNRSFSGTEDTPLTVSFSATDVDGDTPTFAVVAAPTRGSLSGTGSSRTYTPNANFNGVDTFTYRATDPSGANSNLATVTITLAEVNDPPSAAATASTTVAEDTPASITLSASDPESTPAQLTYSVTSAPGRGSLSISGSTATYSPQAHFHGTDSFRWRATDPQGAASNEGTVTITVTPAPDRPVASSRSASTDEDTPVAIALLATDADGDALTYVITTAPVTGTATITGATATFTPAPNVNGVVAFNYAARDPGGLQSTPATVTVTIRAVNDAPVALDGDATTSEDLPVEVTLAATDIELDALSYTIIDPPGNGTVVPVGGARFRYAPAQDFHGSDSFTFLARDATQDSAPATVTLTVTPVNDPPVATGTTVNVLQDTPREFTLEGRDVDSPATPLTFQVLEPPVNGVLTGNAPALRYVPYTLFEGTDSFRFTVTDPEGTTSAPATVILDVQDGNDPPVARPVAYTINEDTATNFALDAVDDDGDTLTVTIVTPPLRGTVTGGELPVRYTPARDYSGTDSFRYRVTDGIFTSSDAVVSITIRAVNDPPVVTGPRNAATAEDVALEVRPEIRDVDGPSLTWRIIRPPSNGTARLGATGFTYTPRADYSGVDQMQYAAFDGLAQSEVIPLTITVASVNDAPVAVARTLTTPEDVGVDVLFAGTDVDGDAIVFEVATMPEHGTVEGAPPRVRYVPARDFNGTDRFTYVALDGSSTSVPAVVDITVSPANDAPTATAAAHALDEDTSAAFQLEGADIDGDPLTFQVEQAPTRGTLTPVGSGQFRYAPFADYVGPDSFLFRVSDGRAVSSPARVDLTVRAVNDPPRLVAPTPTGPQQVTEGGTLTFRISGADVDDDVLQREVVPMPPGATLDAVTGVFRWVPSFTDAGTHPVDLVVRDAARAEDRRRIDLVVSGVDVDRDGLPDTWELSVGLDPGTKDSDHDNIPDLDEVGDIAAPRDTDGDGELDASDDDSDDDGVADVDEAGDTSIDTPARDTDLDGVEDYRSPDSDADGTDDGTDNCRLVANRGQEDIDRDGTGDACDDDRDGDGHANALETAVGGDPDLFDTDGDRISDRDELFVGADTARPADTDRDDTPDVRDLDSDGDGVLDIVEAGDSDPVSPPVDTDLDGTPDFRDTDSDGDGVNDGVDLCRLVPDPAQEDLNRNGIGDWCEGDGDGDGINDASDNCPALANTDQSDLDTDGLGDACDTDKDGDDVPDREDPCPRDFDPGQQDSDRDGLGDACDPVFDATVSGGCSGWDATLLGLLALVRRRRRRD